jgi:hypothetical protein
VPAGAGMEGPALLLALDDVRGEALPSSIFHVVGVLGAADRHDIGDERIEEPSLLRVAPVAFIEMNELPQLLAHFDAKLDAAVPEHLARLALVHLGVHVERCEQRVERRGRDLHQKGFVEPLVLDIAGLPADMLVLLVDLARLGEAGALLVHGLGREKPRGVRPEALEAHRAVTGEQRMKGVVADPGLVPQDVVAEVPDLLQDLADVVDGSVIGRELDAGEAERTLGIGAALVLDERVFGDAPAQAVLIPGVPVHRADHAEGIARGRQVNRDRTRLDQSALVQRFVVVPVEQHEVACADQRVGDDFVRGAGAVQDEVGAVGAEHARRVLLRLDRGSLMDEQVAEVHIGVAKIVPEYAFAEILEEELACGRLAIELAALVAGAVEGDVRLAVIRHQPAEEGRQQGLSVIDQARDDLLGIESRGLLAEIGVSVDLAHHLDHAEIGYAMGVGQRP